MNAYLEMMKRHQQEVNEFPIKYAFSKEGFERGMRELGLDPISDKDKVVSVSGGAFIRETDKRAFIDMFERHTRERDEAVAADTTGRGFAYDMFRYELGNHEYAYTRDLTETIDALGYDEDDFAQNASLAKALENARNDFLREADEKGWGC